MDTRQCTRCDTTVPGKAECPTCAAWFEGRPDADTMTGDARAEEFASWGVAEIEFGKVHQRLEELVGRPVMTHELGLNWDGLVEEARARDHPTLDEVVGLIPEDMPTVVVDFSDRLPVGNTARLPDDLAE